MIRYSLACEAGHRFDSWFGDSGAFDDLVTRALVSCPTCASTRVAKTIMAPAVLARGGAVPPAAEATGPTEQTGPDKRMVDVSLLDDRRRDMRALVQAFRAKVLAETQDVGGRFPDEARRMHDGDIPHRDIRGQATIEEARGLLDDGIMVLPLPPAPEDFN